MVPAGQDAQEVALTTLLKVPAAHGIQADRPLAMSVMKYVPAGQEAGRGTSTQVVRLSLAVKPKGQTVQVTAPATVEIEF